MACDGANLTRASAVPSAGIAANLHAGLQAAGHPPLRVWNRTAAKATAHSAAHGFEPTAHAS